MFCLCALKLHNTYLFLNIDVMSYSLYSLLDGISDLIDVMVDQTVYRYESIVVHFCASVNYTYIYT